MKRIAPAAVAALLSACAATEIGGVLHPSVSGSITIGDGADMRQWAPDRCVSGDLSYFAGFDFHSSRDAATLRAVQSPVDGPVVRWNAGDPERPPQVVHPADCSVLVVDARPTAWHVNDVREFAGFVELHCATRDGLRIDGRVDVDHCH